MELGYTDYINNNINNGIDIIKEINSEMQVILILGLMIILILSLIINENKNFFIKQ